MGKILDLTGKKFGKLTCIKMIGKTHNKKCIWLCKCDCGNTKEVPSRSLTSGHTKSCGCACKESNKRKNLKDLTNKRIGKLTCIRIVGFTSDSRAIWLCKCDCGKTIEIISHNLLRKSSKITKSCGCTKHEITLKKKNGDLTGKKFGRLKVLNITEKPAHIKKKAIFWLCECECGNKTIVNSSNLKSGNSRSCGCLRYEILNGIHYKERDIELTVFKPILAKIKARGSGDKFHRKIKVTITLKDLKEIWEKQKGVCPYTGIKLLLPSWYDSTKKDVNLSSVDRIDSSKGYTKDNIQFVCLPMNYAKNSYSQEDILYICENIKKNFNKNNFKEKKNA